MNPLVKINFRKIDSYKRGGMLDYIERHPHRIPLKSRRGYPNIYVHFYYNKNTGQIIQFGDIQNIDTVVRNNPHNISGTFRIMVNYHKKPKLPSRGCRIVEFIHNKKLTAEALATIEASMRMFNEIVGFSIPLTTRGRLLLERFGIKKRSFSTI